MRRVVPATDNSMNIVSPTHHDQEITGRFHQKAYGSIQCPLDIATSDTAAALPIAT